LGLHTDQKLTLKSQKLFFACVFLIRGSFALSGFTRIKNTRGDGGFAVCVFDPCVLPEGPSFQLVPKKLA
jgi:hypothetical protein